MRKKLQRPPVLNFAKEIVYRTNSARESIDLYLKYKNKVIQLQKLHKDKKHLKFNKITREDDTAIYDFYLIKEKLLCFAILEICTLLDGTGKFSFVLSKNREGKYIGVQHDRFAKLVTINKDRADVTERMLNHLIRKNSKLILRMINSRHGKIAHASHLSENVLVNSVDEYKSFPYKNFVKFVEDFSDIVVLGIYFSPEFYPNKK